MYLCASRNAFDNANNGIGTQSFRRRIQYRKTRKAGQGRAKKIWRRAPGRVGWSATRRCRAGWPTLPFAGAPRGKLPSVGLPISPPFILFVLLILRVGEKLIERSEQVLHHADIRTLPPHQHHPLRGCLESGAFRFDANGSSEMSPNPKRGRAQSRAPQRHSASQDESPFETGRDCPRRLSSSPRPGARIPRQNRVGPPSCGSRVRALRFCGHLCP